MKSWIYFPKQIEMDFGLSPIIQKDPLCTGCFEVSWPPRALNLLWELFKNVLKAFFTFLSRKVHRPLIQQVLTHPFARPVPDPKVSTQLPCCPQSVNPAPVSLKE